jgi:hypothetical protein
VKGSKRFSARTFTVSPVSVGGCQKGLSLATVLVCLFWTSLWPPQAGAAQTAQSSATIRDSLARADKGETELHIFYVHGIGINPPKHSPSPQVFETSLEFRTGFCRLKQVQCTTKAGEPQGRFYANQHFFDPTADRDGPRLSYLGQDIWREHTDDWLASAPFVDNYILKRKHGATILLHEINWWPLVLAAKCRQIIATDSALVDHDKIHTQVCSTPTSGPDANGRYKSYQWIAATCPAPDS